MFTGREWWGGGGRMGRRGGEWGGGVEGSSALPMRRPLQVYDTSLVQDLRCQTLALCFNAVLHRVVRVWYFTVNCG